MKELNPTEIWGPQPRPITFDRAIILLAVLLSALGLITALMHAGPAGPRGYTGTPGQQGATGAQGPAGTSPYDPYDKVCSLPGVLYQGSYITGYYPCSNVNPNG